MGELIRWLHLSDFHVGKDDYAQRRIFEHIVEHVRARRNEGPPPDFVFLTGDLANRGKGSEYEEFWLEFVGPLHEAIGGDVDVRTFIVPGNHDVDRDRNQAFDREAIAQPASRYLDPTAEGLQRREILLPRFAAFCANDLTVATGGFDGQAGAYSATVDVRGSRIGIAGINTAWLCKDKADERRLTPGKALLDEALATLADADVRIVLGHHPLDWLIRAQQRQISALLGQHSAIYLHGHLHEEWAEPAYGAGAAFLNVQAGAAFAVRDGEPWRNGLVWGEVDLEHEEVLLQPWRWEPDQHAWALASGAFPETHRRGDRWAYALPGSPASRAAAQAARPPKVPRGWHLTDARGLQRHVQPLDEVAAVAFFDGSVPGWETALSSSIPRRAIVGRLASAFAHPAEGAKPIATLLLAPACEGKTTALLQAAHVVAQSDPSWRVLRRLDDTAGLGVAELLDVIDAEHHWLIVIDEADGVANELHALAGALPVELDGRVHFMLACRDSDWLGSPAASRNWSGPFAFHRHTIAGVGDGDDAALIVGAWAAIGADGLGELAKVPEQERVAALLRYGGEEAKSTSGAFFGALLVARHGERLLDHARLLLERLATRTAAGGASLRDALVYIAAMHAEGLEFLSRPVLAKVLGCPPGDLQRTVLVPLGHEAGATASSTYVFTRHRRIAAAIIELYEAEFGDVSMIYIDLATAAVEAALSGAFIPPNLAKWRFAFSDHFVATDRTPLALDIARAVLAAEPDQRKTRVHLARLYREAGAPDQALRLLREAPAGDAGRGYYREWAVCEGAANNQPAGVVLAAYSISDECPLQAASRDEAGRSLASLGVAFGELHAAYNDSTFQDARAAVGVIGAPLTHDMTTKAHLNRYCREAVAAGASLPELAEAFERLQAGVRAADALGADVGSTLPPAASFSFGHLRRLSGMTDR